MLDSAGGDTGASSPYVERLLEAPKSQYDGWEISDTQSFGGWCGKKVSQQKHFGVKLMREVAGQCEKGYSRSALQREAECVV